MAYYQITKMEQGVYRLTSRECVYMDLIVGEERALLFDTGWGVGNLYETVRQITDKPLIVVNSHGHVDHVNGNFQFKGNIYIHPWDIELCQVQGSVEMKNYLVMFLENTGILPDSFDKEWYLKVAENSYIPVEEGHIFNLGGKTLEVVELPGHTVGSIGLLYREGGILYVGDAINGALLLSGPEAAPLNVYIQTLKKAKTLDFNKMAQGHSEKIYGKEILETYQKVAERVDWDKALPYKDPNNAQAQENPDVRVMCSEGKTLDDVQDPDFACIVFTKEKL